MTDDEYDDDMRAWARDVFSDENRPPRDVVPGPGLTLDDLRRQNDATGETYTVEQPGAVVEDVDGVPHYVEPSTIEHGLFGGTTISTNQLAELGLTPDELARDYPNIRLMRSPEPTRKDDSDD